MNKVTKKQEEQVPSQILISFLNLQIININMNVKSGDKEVTNNAKISMKYNNIFNAKDKKQFGVKYELTIENEDFSIDLIAVSNFSTNIEIGSEFKASSFPRINAPAISYPYLRSFVSILTMNSGYNPIILPTFNFVKRAEEKNKSKKS